jgi:hypothetical protein
VARGIAIDFIPPHLFPLPLRGEEERKTSPRERKNSWTLSRERIERGKEKDDFITNTIHLHQIEKEEKMVRKVWSNVFSVRYVLKIVSLLAGIGLLSHVAAIVTFERTYGGTDSDRGFAVQQTQDGGYIISGSTWSFGVGQEDIYVIKTDSLGDTLWTKTFGGTNWDRSRSVQQTQDGGYIISGWSQSFGNGLPDVYLIKTDASGDTVWTKVHGGTSADESFCVRQTSDGGYISVGRTNSYGAGDFDVYLVKTDALGDTMWTKTFGSTFIDYGICVQQTSDQGYVVVGMNGSLPGGDIYLIKTDSLGDSLWTRTYGGNNSDTGYFVNLTQDGGYIIAGATGSYGAGGNDVWLLRIDGNGDTLWTRTYGGSDYDGGFAVQEIQDGYIIGGRTTSFGAGGLDLYLIKIDASGDTIWTRTYGGAEVDWYFSGQQTQDGGYILAGYTASFGAGSDDVYLIKTNQHGLVGIEEGQDMNLQIENVRLEQSQPNPSHSMTTIRFQIATPGHVCINVYDACGRVIKTLVDEEKEAGVYSISWHGHNELGENVPAGVYFYRLEAGKYSQMRKMIMFR